MKKVKLIFYVSLITLLWIMVYFTTVYGASVTMQREGGLKSQEIAVAKEDVNRDGNQPTFSPLRLKNKTDSGMESDTGNPSVKVERYKPYKEGEGERKIK